VSSVTQRAHAHSLTIEDQMLAAGSNA
jgi:hypothetical protein